MSVQGKENMIKSLKSKIIFLLFILIIGVFIGFQADSLLNTDFSGMNIENNYDETVNAKNRRATSSFHSHRGHP